MAALVQAGLATVSAAPLPAKLRGILDYRAPKFLIAEARRSGAVSDYEVACIEQIDVTLTEALGDIDLVREGYFSARSSMDGLTDAFETDPWSGGNGRIVTLMALYVHTGRLDKLRALAASLDSAQTAPMNIKARDYFLALR